MSKTRGEGRSSTCYIAGPISGLPEVPLQEKIDRFYTAQADLEAWGFAVINPLLVKPVCDMSCNTDGHIGQDGVATHSWACFMKHDLRALLDCTHIAILPGWKESRGAELEIRIAQALGMQEIHMDFDSRPYPPLTTNNTTRN